MLAPYSRQIQRQKPRLTSTLHGWVTHLKIPHVLSQSETVSAMLLVAAGSIHLSDRSHLSERVMIDWLHMTTATAIPSMHSSEGGRVGLVVTALPVNKIKVKDDKNNNNNNKLALLIRNAKFINPLHVNRRIQPESRKPNIWNQLFKAWLAKRVQLRLFGRPFLWVLFCPASF